MIFVCISLYYFFRFIASSHLDKPFQMRARKVSMESYTHCDVTEGIAVTDEFTSEQFEVPSDMLQIGSNYFIGMKANIFVNIMQHLLLWYKWKKSQMVWKKESSCLSIQLFMSYELIDLKFYNFSGNNCTNH